MDPEDVLAKKSDFNKVEFICSSQMKELVGRFNVKNMGALLLNFFEHCGNRHNVEEVVSV